MSSNGKIPTKQLAALPISWSNKDEQEYLTPSAYASFSRMIARAVAETGVNFQLYDAYRSFAEQVHWLKEYYEPARSGRRYDSYRTFQGRRWGQKPGKPKAAQPGRSNHGLGVSVDIHPGPIQAWLRRNAARFGWVNDVPSEAWHWSYLHPNRDRYREEGALDHAWVQKVVGAEVDGKIGTGTVEKIKAYQIDKGLEGDGIVGPNTRQVMEGGAAPEPAAPGREPEEELAPGTSDGFTYTYTREEWDTEGVGEKVHAYDAEVAGIYLHWPGSSDTFKGLSADEIAAVLRGYRRDHTDGNGWNDIGYGAAVDWAGRTYELRGLGMEVGSNGGNTSNSEAGSILFLLGTREVPTPEMIEGGNGLLAQYADRHGKGYIRGHKESPDASTSCPGARIMGLIEDGSLNWDGSASVVVPEETIGTAALEVDGRLGTATAKDLQRYLNQYHGANLKVDGKLGHATWSALQTALGTPVDGEVSNQSYEAEELGNGITQGWEFTGRGSKGSPMVEKLQSWAGAKPDGTWFEATTAKVQEKLNTYTLV